MRELDECKAEVFRRSEKRIKERKRARNRVMTWCICLCLIITLGSVTILPAMLPAGMGMLRKEEQYSGENEEPYVGDTATDGNAVLDGADGMNGAVSLGHFSFSLTWGCYGISSYDSETGKLVKTTDATHPEDYVTTYQLSAAQMLRIYDLIANLNVSSYPDTYNPHKDGLASDPSMTLILSVKTDTFEKTITAENIAFTYESNDKEGQKFLTVCKEIRDILIETDEWKELPEYEFFYD